MQQSGAQHFLRDVIDLLDAAGLRVTTMGRGPVDDPLFFRTVAAAAQRAVASRTEGGTVWHE